MKGEVSVITQERGRTRTRRDEEEKWLVDREGWVPGLRVSINQKWYVFPWSHFLYAEGDGDEVKAAFTTHDVTFKGEGLWPLLDYIQNQRLVQIETALRADRFESNGGSAVYDIIVKSVDEK
jgi:hypothetical protein